MTIRPEAAYDRLKKPGLSAAERVELAEIACQDSRFAYLTFCGVNDLPEEIRQLALKKACEDPRWAFCIIFEPKFAAQLDAETRRRAELKACEDPETAYHLRVFVHDTPAEIRRRAEWKACDHPMWALLLRKNCKDISESVRRRAELRACSREKTRKLLELAGPLHPDTQKLFDLVQLGVDPETAFQIVTADDEEDEAC